MSGNILHSMMTILATFFTALLPLMGILGIAVLITEGIVPCIIRHWQSKENNRQIGKLIAKSRNY